VVPRVQRLRFEQAICIFDFWSSTFHMSRSSSAPANETKWQASHAKHGRSRIVIDEFSISCAVIMHVSEAQGMCVVRASLFLYGVGHSLEKERVADYQNMNLLSFSSYTNYSIKSFTNSSGGVINLSLRQILNCFNSRLPIDRIANCLTIVRSHLRVKLCGLVLE
jgi:hypothetical protein